MLIHPLAGNDVDDHTIHKMWLGDPYPLNMATLNSTGGGESAQYPELKLGYSEVKK